MSTIKATIYEAMKAAMRAQEKERLLTIRLIQSEIKRIEVDERIEIDDQRMLVILDKMLKQRRDSITQFEAGNRPELAAVEAAEILVIQSFLPAQLSDNELKAIIDAAILESGATSMKDMSKVMALVKPQIQGKADASEVSKAIKARFS